MNIYIESGSFFHNLRVVRACCKAFAKATPINFHLLAPKGICAGHVFHLINGRPGVSGVTLHLPPKRLGPLLTLFVNTSSAVTLQAEVGESLTATAQKKLLRLHGPIRVHDTSGEANRQFYEQHRQILSDLYEADIYQLAAWGRTVFQCRYSSCLGKTLYIDRQGHVSFCPHHPEESRIGTWRRLDDVFEADAFREVLIRTIAKRKTCKQVCAHFEQCKGGCPFTDDCEAFRSRFASAVRELDSHIQADTALSALPLHKELALLRRLCDISQ